jgi:hypothetical protein
VSQTPSTDPADIFVSTARREMRILWQDGHESVYPFDLLRRECPCALCNDQRSKESASAGPSLTVLSGPVLKAGVSERASDQALRHQFCGMAARRWDLPRSTTCDPVPYVLSEGPSGRLAVSAMLDLVIYSDYL